MQKASKLIPLFGGPILFLLVKFILIPEDLSTAGVSVLACTLWIAIWWIFEVVDISVTALLPIVLFPLTGALEISKVTASYGHKFIFLYMGGFILAIAIEKWNLHKRIALTIIKLIGSGIHRIILGFMIATAFMSMWISNTATTVMMLPIGLAIISQIKDHPDTPEDENEMVGKALMLSIAYAASIGGMATLFGTPPNLVFAGVVNELYDIEITFSQWLMFGLPISIILLFITWYYLTRIVFKFKIKQFPGGKKEIQRLYTSLGKFSYEEKTVFIVFLLTAIGLITRQWLKIYIPFIDDTIIAMTAGLALFLLPSKDSNKRIISWSEAVKMPWGVLILFGGGMAIATGFEQSGLAIWIGEQFTSLQGLPLLLLLLIIITSVNFLTEMTSNMATTAMLLPILAPMALSIGVHPYILLVAATVAASCAFMLPVATPPNAIVFGSGYLKIKDMIRTGFALNILSIIILTFIIYLFLEKLWGFDAFTITEAFK